MGPPVVWIRAENLLDCPLQGTVRVTRGGRAEIGWTSNGPSLALQKNSFPSDKHSGISGCSRKLKPIDTAPTPAEDRA
jgi:hypothetical protein